MMSVAGTERYNSFNCLHNPFCTLATVEHFPPPIERIKMYFTNSKVEIDVNRFLAAHQKIYVRCTFAFINVENQMSSIIILHKLTRGWMASCKHAKNANNLQDFIHVQFVMFKFKEIFYVF